MKTTKQPINTETAIFQFRTITDKLTEQVAAWAMKKPAKRTALLFFCDDDAEEWILRQIEYQTGKRPKYRLLLRIFSALMHNDEIYAHARDLVRSATRQRKKDAKRQAMTQQTPDADDTNQA